MSSGIRVFNTSVSTETTDAAWVAYLHPVTSKALEPDDDAERENIDFALAGGEPIGMGATKALALMALSGVLDGLSTEALNYASVAAEDE